jgi:DNA invertase Pin-like site-specific DNA recombinase
MARLVSYLRVSSVDQNEARQREAIGQVDREFVDKCSGKDIERPALREAISALWPGDMLVVHSMDRLSRNMSDLSKLVKDLTDKGVTVKFIKEGLTFTGSDDKMAQLMLGILGSVAQFERALIKERQAEGIAIAKREGVYKGRKPSLTPIQVTEMKALAASGVPKSKLAVKYKVSRETIYQYIAASA